MSTTQHWIPGSAKPRRGPFRTKYQGYQLRTLIWTCTYCRAQFTTKPATCDQCQGQTFHYFQSRAEANRYPALLLQQQTGLITDLKVHTEFPVFGLDRAGKPVALFTYISDFDYEKAGKRVIEDVKPSMHGDSHTDVFKLKRRCVEKTYGIEITLYAPSA